jgi:hypothetical protein
MSDLIIFVFGIIVTALALGPFAFALMRDRDG